MAFGKRSHPSGAIRPVFTVSYSYRPARYVKLLNISSRTSTLSRPLPPPAPRPPPPHSCGHYCTCCLCLWATRFQLTCRGAWHCTQHPSVETLFITLCLLPGADLVPPEEVKTRGSRSATRAAATAATAAAPPARNVAAAGCSAEDRTDDGSAVADRRMTAAVPGSGCEQWACGRCTLFNSERR